MAGSKNTRIKPVPVIVLGVVIVVIIAGIAVFAINNTSDKQQNNSATVSVSKKNLKENTVSTEPVKASTTVEIQWDDSAVLVGTVFKITAIVTPDDTEHALVWSSSNPDICAVDNDGVVTVKGAGNAAVTATIGTVSDSVIIQGITNMADGSDRGLPVYTGDSYITSEQEIARAGSAGGETYNSQNVKTSGNSSQEAVDYSQQGNSNNNSGNDNDTQQGINSDDSTVNNAGNNTVDNSGNNTDYGTGVVPDNSQNYDSGSHSGIASTDVSGYLPQIGYTQRMSNVYVCEDGQNYYGEIIVQPNVTIIYIKQRSDAFDSMIQNTLSTLLPSDDGQVWNNYISSSSDRTFTVDGRRVRIVTAVNGGHSQIVVYN